MFKVNMEKCPSGKTRWAVNFANSCIASGVERTLKLARYAAQIAQREQLRRLKPGREDRMFRAAFRDFESRSGREVLKPF